MKKFERKRKMKNWLYSKFSIFFLFFLVFILARGSVGVYQKARESFDRRNVSMASLTRLNEKKTYLNNEIERLESRVGLEEELRSRYSLAKEGEKVITIVDHDENEGSLDPKPEDTSPYLEKINSWIKRLILLE